MTRHSCRVVESVVIGHLLKVSAKIDGRVVTEEFDAKATLDRKGGEKEAVHYMSTKYCLCPIIDHAFVPQFLKPVIPHFGHRIRRAWHVLRGKRIDLWED